MVTHDTDTNMNYSAPRNFHDENSESLETSTY